MAAKLMISLRLITHVWRLTKPVVAVCLLAVLAGCVSIPAEKASAQRSVITATQATYSLTNALLNDTGIETVNIPVDGRRFASLKNYMQRRKERLTPIFKAADAVVAYTNMLGSDPLYRYARAANIELTYIDAAQPWGFDAMPVSLVDQPQTDVAWANADKHPPKQRQSSDYFWLSISNAVRMADIIGSDLARLFPDVSDTIVANLAELKASLNAINRQAQAQLLEAEAFTVFALANEFVYLTNDLGLFVEGYFLKQDVNWTAADLAAFSAHLSSRQIRVVLHKWQPSEAIQQAIADAGATLVVLDTADPGRVQDRKLLSDGYQQILNNNAEQLIKALQQVSDQH